MVLKFWKPQPHGTLRVSPGLERDSFAFTLITSLAFIHPFIQHFIELSKPTGNFTYHQVLHSKILLADYISFMCFVLISEEKVSFALHFINLLVFYNRTNQLIMYAAKVTVCVYSAVRTYSLYNTDTSRP
jgi:hypothetical protein